MSADILFRVLTMKQLTCPDSDDMPTPKPVAKKTLHSSKICSLHASILIPQFDMVENEVQCSRRRGEGLFHTRLFIENQRENNNCGLISPSHDPVREVVMNPIE